MPTIITLGVLTLIGFSFIWLEIITEYEYSRDEGAWLIVACFILVPTLLTATPAILVSQYNAYLHNPLEYQAAERKVERITELFTDYKAEDVGKAIENQSILSGILEALPESSEGFKFKTEVMNSVVTNIEKLYEVRKKMEYINRHPWWIFKYNKFPWEGEK